MGEKTGEILVHLQYIREGMDALNTRLDVLNGRTRAVEQKVATLETLDRRELSIRNAARRTAKNMGTAKLVTAGTAALFALAAALEAAKVVLTRLAESWK